LLVDGDPTKDINLLANPQRNFLVIIKNGTIYKNTLH
jgi:imidazolonepropionase-like amidohydrolase